MVRFPVSPVRLTSLPIVIHKFPKTLRIVVLFFFFLEGGGKNQEGNIEELKAHRHSGLGSSTPKGEDNSSPSYCLSMMNFPAKGPKMLVHRMETDFHGGPTVSLSDRALRWKRSMITRILLFSGIIKLKFRLNGAYLL